MNEVGAISGPERDGSDLTIDACLNQSFTQCESADFPSDTASYFETWIDNLKANRSWQNPAANNSSAAQLKFEGTLWVDFHLAFVMLSQTGTLVVTETGEIESDIKVAVAIIDGQVRGNIHATERVELRSHARVIGNIEAPAVAIQPGAVFEGRCHFLPVRNRAVATGSEARA